MQQNHDKFDKRKAGAVSCLLLPLFLLNVHTTDQLSPCPQEAMLQGRTPKPSMGRTAEPKTEVYPQTSPSAPGTTHLLHEPWLAYPPMVCVTFNKIIPPGGLVDATNHKSNHGFTPCCVCGFSPVSVLGCWGGPDSFNQRTQEQMQFRPTAWAEQLEFQV